jgi:hypothetical protein
MKMTTKHWLTLLSSSLLCSSIVMAKPLDISDQEKDMRIMRGILESSLESSREDFPGRPNIKSTYLADQGFLFTIRLNGISGFGIPGVASWDSGRLELDIPEIIEEAFAAVEMSDMMDPEALAEVETIFAPEPPEPPGVPRISEQSRELQEQLRTLREQQRELRRQVYDTSREIRRATETEQREKLEQRLAGIKADLEQKKDAYNSTLNNYKTERLSKQIARSDKAVDAILQTLCDYGQTMRTLKKDEKVNILIQGGVTGNGERASQMYIFDQKDIKGCKDFEKLKKEGIYYTI